MGQFSKRLSGMRTAWKKGRDAGNTGKVPPGVYVAKLLSAELGESQASNRMQIHREHVIQDGEFAGESVHDYMGLESEKGPFFCELWLNKMGYETGDEFDPVQVEAICEEMTESNPTVKIKVVEKDGFTNVRVIGLVDTGTAPAKEEVEEEAPAEEEEVEEEAPAEEEEAVEEEVEEEAAEEEAVEEEEAPAEDDEERAELLSLAAAFGIDVSDDDEKKTIVSKLKALQWPASELEASEVALLKKVGIRVVQDKSAPVAPPKKSAPVAATKSAKSTSKVAPTSKHPVKGVKKSLRK